ncbi:DNA repair protein RadC [Candidatus Bealeia paramacronuclearis]|uniref:DNA repair protein RadC n=1 Tax=Candidatus Bealeia paramacronuclearis TaxID=1921001 RepID=A0ABZ2C4R0_9PROT|nr:DNA repair protein RadC [Candidatus Bealeia paramacronuclearis]
MEDLRFGHRERLRSRFLETDGKGVQDYELLEMILFSAKPRGDVKPLAKILLKKFGSLKQVLLAPPHELQNVSEMGPAAVTTIKLAQELTQRILLQEIMNQPVLNNWEKVIQYCQHQMGHLNREQLRILFLDRKNQLIADEIQQEGTLDQTPIFPREVVRRALEHGAGALILVHNHPSGDPTPSEADIQITQKVILAARTMDIRVHDHIIVGRHESKSFKQLGLI